jgi:hypothetical protein
MTSFGQDRHINLGEGGGRKDLDRLREQWGERRDRGMRFTGESLHGMLSSFAAAKVTLR